MSHLSLQSARKNWCCAILFGFILSVAANTRAADPALLKVGMIGLDASQVPAVAKVFNYPNVTGDLAGIKEMAGYPGGTDMPASRERVKGFTEQLRGMGIEIVATIPELLEKVAIRNSAFSFDDSSGLIWFRAGPGGSSISSPSWKPRTKASAAEAL